MLETLLKFYPKPAFQKALSNGRNNLGSNLSVVEMSLTAQSSKQIQHSLMDTNIKVIMVD